MQDGPEKFKAWRQARGLTQAQAADALSCTQTRVSQIEAGKNRPSFRLAIAISTLTNGEVSLGDWVGSGRRPEDAQTRGESGCAA